MSLGFNHALGDSMANHPGSILYAGFVSGILVLGCATHPTEACRGDPESLGYRDGALGRQSCASIQSGESSVAYLTGWNEGIQRFCTEENGYQQGCQGVTFANVCPDTMASVYLDGYQSGYAVYLMQLEVDAMERTIESKSDELEQVWSALDAVAENLEQGNIEAAQRSRWLDELHALSTRETRVSAELDELESEVGARKAQLTQLRHAIATND